MNQLAYYTHVSQKETLTKRVTCDGNSWKNIINIVGAKKKMQ